jgi:hypothetical protein
VQQYTDILKSLKGLNKSLALRANSLTLCNASPMLD